MVDRESTCKACEGAGMLSDDEGWQYACSVCRGKGVFQSSVPVAEAKVMDVDHNNRLLD